MPTLILRRPAQEEPYVADKPARVLLVLVPSGDEDAHVRAFLAFIDSFESAGLTRCVLPSPGVDSALKLFNLVVMLLLTFVYIHLVTKVLNVPINGKLPGLHT